MQGIAFAGLQCFRLGSRLPSCFVLFWIFTWDTGHAASVCIRCRSKNFTKGNDQNSAGWRCGEYEEAMMAEEVLHLDYRSPTEPHISPSSVLRGLPATIQILRTRTSTATNCSAQATSCLLRPASTAKSHNENSRFRANMDIDFYFRWSFLASVSLPERKGSKLQ